MMDSDKTYRNETLTQAMQALIDHNYGTGIELFSKIIDEQPENHMAIMSRGTAYLRTDDIGSALEDFNRVIELDPDNARARHMRALTYEKMGNNPAALDDINRAIDLNPEYGVAYFSRATLNTKMGRTDEATNDIQMVAHLTNRNIEEFANENNVWRSQHLRLESMMESELNR